MLPHERSLVDKLEGKPFVLLGVNTDKDRAALQERLGKERVTWRNFWDGTDGPICKAWNVRVFPTTYLIDGEGRIRFRDLRGAEAETAIAQLLDELARKGAKVEAKAGGK